MGTDASKRDATRLELEKLRVREERRQQLPSYADDEPSDVIEVEARSRMPLPKSESTPPRAKAIVAILNAFPPGSRPYVAVACLGMLLAALAYSGALTGIVDWAKK